MAPSIVTFKITSTVCMLDACLLPYPFISRPPQILFSFLYPFSSYLLLSFSPVFFQFMLQTIFSCNSNIMSAFLILSFCTPFHPPPPLHSHLLLYVAFLPFSKHPLPIRQCCFGFIHFGACTEPFVFYTLQTRLRILILFF